MQSYRTAPPLSARVAQGMNLQGMNVQGIHSETTRFHAGSCPTVETPHTQNQSGYQAYSGYGIAAFVVGWIVLSIIIYFIMYAFRPDFCRKRSHDGDCCEEVDCCRAFLWAIFIALIIILIIFAVSCWCRSNKTSC